MTLEFYSWFPVNFFFFFGYKTHTVSQTACSAQLRYHAGIDTDIIRLIYEIQATMADRL